MEITLSQHGPNFSPNASYYLRGVGGKAFIDDIAGEFITKYDQTHMHGNSDPITLNGAKFEFLGCGLSRTGYRYRDIVLKVPRVSPYTPGSADCLREFLIYNAAYAHKKHRVLAATVAVFKAPRCGWVAVAQFVPGVSLYNMHLEGRVRRRTWKTLYPLGIEAYDIHSENFGDGYKVLDYGHFQSDNINSQVRSLL